MVLWNGKTAIHNVDPGPSTRYTPLILCIDPGDVHVGLAEFEYADGRWICRWAGEMTPEAFLPWFAGRLKRGDWARVVVESWKLFPQAAPLYVGSDMPTSRLIGAVTALVAFIPEEGWFDPTVELFLQDPQIKVPTRGWLKRRKMRSVAKVLKVSGDHAQDAELHGYKHLIDRGEAIANSNQQEAYLRQHHSLTPRHDLW